MVKLNRIVIILIMVTMAFVTACGPCLARTIAIPGETEEEYKINSVMRSVNEEEATMYLNDQSESIRIAACMRLAEIGTAYSLLKLEELATETDESYEVQREASISLWKIRYRQTKKVDDDTTVFFLSILNEDGDKTKIAYVKGWAIEILGDEGREEAVSAILDEELIASSSDYLKEKVETALAKIDFISSYPADTDIMTIINEGLMSESQHIKQWALKKLVSQKPDDLADRLKTLFADVQEKKDYDFMFHVSLALNELGIRLRDLQVSEGEQPPVNNEPTVPPEPVDPPSDYPSDQPSDYPYGSGETGGGDESSGDPSHPDDTAEYNDSMSDYSDYGSFYPDDTAEYNDSMSDYSDYGSSY